MQAERADRMFAGLPAVYRDRDTSGELAALLAVFEALFFGGSGEVPTPLLPGIEQQLPEIPALFAPRDEVECGETKRRTPEAFMHWLANWLSFAPHALFSPEALRRIVAGIVPLYGRRGTREYLAKLLELCFGAEVQAIHLDDRPRVGLTIGVSAIGVDARLATSRPFWFKVVVDSHAQPGSDSKPQRVADLERRLRAVIDFAKPAHTAYELQWRRPAHAAAPHGREAERPARTVDRSSGE